MLDAVDMEILMHRDAHFSSSFPIMVEYYRKGGPGVMSDFSSERLLELQYMEEKYGKNFCDIALPEAAKKEVSGAKEMYSRFREVYQGDSEVAKKLSDLILSEEDSPDDEIDAVMRMGPEMIPHLIDLIRSDHFYDPLYPGYGRSPALAARCLGKMPDERALAPLFEAVGRGDFWADECMMTALHGLGESAKVFLIERLYTKPVTSATYSACACLGCFSSDPEIGKAAWTVLKDPEYQKNDTLNAYLILLSENLDHENDRREFTAWVEGLEKTDLISEAQLIIKNWN